jgi:hypothetical protein
MMEDNRTKYWGKVSNIGKILMIFSIVEFIIMCLVLLYKG